jgi:tRNA pseudouridine55 synthase
MHSAVRVGGKRLYDWARAGVEMDRPARTITINSLKLTSFSGENLVISVNCSKGTYIRVLAEDIGARLGCGAYLTALRRTAIGPLQIEQSVALATLEAADAEGCLTRLLPAEVLVSALPRVTLEAAGARALGRGQRPAASSQAPAGDCAVFGPDSRFLGVARVEGGAWVAVRMMGTNAEAPDSP